MTDTNAMIYLKDIYGGELIPVPGTLNADGTISFGLAQRVPVGNVARLDLISFDGGPAVNVPVTIENDGRVILGSANNTQRNRAYLPVQVNGKSPVLLDVNIASDGAPTIPNGMFQNPAVAPTFDYAEIGLVSASTVVVRFSIAVTASNYASGVTIKKNGSTQTISSATRQSDHTVVRYVLSAPADANDTVTWEYAKADGTLASEFDGTVLEDVSAQAVVDNIAAVPPQYSSAEIGTVNDTTVAVTFTTKVSAAGNDFSTGVIIKVNTVSKSISTGTRQTDHHIVYYVIPAVDANDVVTVEYNQSTGHIINEDDGGVMATFTAQAVTNNVAPVPPEYDSGEVGLVAAATVEATYTTKVVSADYTMGISIEVNAAPATISSAARQSDHAKVRYVLSAPVVALDTVTISYDADTGDYANEDDGALMADFSDEAVTNNVA